MKHCVRAVPLALFLGFIGCGEGLSPADTASILLNGAPETPLLVGQTAQLWATPLNASGAVISNAPVIWSSSDRDVARVSSSGLVTGVGAGLATITASVGEAEGTADIGVSFGAIVEYSGGTIAMPDGSQLVVPTGAVSQATTVLLGPTANAPSHERKVPGTGYQIGPVGLVFSQPATLALKYQDASIPAGMVGASLQLYRLLSPGWYRVSGSTVNTTTHTVSGTVWGAGVYAVLSTPVHHVTVSGPMVNGALFEGQSVQLTAVVYDSANQVLTGRGVTWSTSDASKVAVDSTGKVTGVAAGSATIAATVEGIQSTTSIATLTRPVADWAGAPEWTTYQGNAGHTGYVPVVADPVVFKESWTTTIAGTGLNAVTAGDGRVYVSSNSYFGTQLAKALNATTGQVVWTRDFGGIHSVDPPAFDNGTVYLQTGGHEDSYLYALNASTGDPRWRTPYGNQWSRYYAPTVVGSNVYVAAGYYGGMSAFRTADGVQQWFIELNQYDQFTPAVSGGLAYAYTGSYTPKLSVVDVGSGQASYTIADPDFNWTGWSMDLAPVLGSSANVLATNGGRLLSFNLADRTIGSAIKTSMVGQVTLGNGVIYVRSGSAIEARKESDGSLQWLWTPPSGTPNGTTIVTKNLLFVSAGAVTYAVDLATHKHVWSHPAGGLLALSGQGILFIAQGNGKLTAITVR